MPDTQHLDPAFAAALQKLMAGAKLNINSGYRSPELQAQLYARALKKYGNEHEARRWVAPPGHSQHNRGMAADLGGDLNFAHANAAKYGLRFPLSNEPWHIELASARNGSPAPSTGNAGSSPLAAFRGALLGQNAGQSDEQQTPPQAPAVPSLDLRMPEPTAPPAGYNPLTDSVLAPFFRSAPQAQPTTITGKSGLQLDEPATTLNDPQALPDDATDAQRLVATLMGINPVNSFQAQGAALRMRGAGAQTALAAIQALAPKPEDYQVTPYQAPAFPTRQTEAIPTRPAPGIDPASSILGAIAGIVDPQAAGHYSAAPLQAAAAAADQQYEDRKQQYLAKLQQDDKSYQDAMDARRGQVETDLYNRDTDQRLHQQFLHDRTANGLEQLSPLRDVTESAAGTPELDALSQQQADSDNQQRKAGILENLIARNERASEVAFVNWQKTKSAEALEQFRQLRLQNDFLRTSMNNATSRQNHEDDNANRLRMNQENNATKQGIADNHDRTSRQNNADTNANRLQVLDKNLAARLSAAENKALRAGNTPLSWKNDPDLAQASADLARLDRAATKAQGDYQMMVRQRGLNAKESLAALADRDRAAQAAQQAQARRDAALAAFKAKPVTPNTPGQNHPANVTAPTKPAAANPASRPDLSQMSTSDLLRRLVEKAK